jgi:uncharacterized protein (TIGR02452 family)
MIYSPRCPVFRHDDGTLLEEPYRVDFITSPAPNAGAIAKNEPENTGQIVPTLRERSSKLLALAAHQGCGALILGAWGRGVFHNDPATVAHAFAEQLQQGKPYSGRFHIVAFAVLDNSTEKATLSAFQQHFAHG